MKFLFAILMFCQVTFANQGDLIHITGKVSSFTDKIVEVKQGDTTLLVPRSMIPKAQIKPNGIVEFDVGKADMNKIKVKK
jgi:hypothetical protein